MLDIQRGTADYDYDCGELNKELSYDEVATAVIKSKVKKSYCLYQTKWLRIQTQSYYSTKYLICVLCLAIALQNRTLAILSLTQKKEKMPVFHYKTGALQLFVVISRK